MQPDPTAIYSTQGQWNDEVETILTTIGQISMNAWSQATDVPPVSRHSFVMAQLAETQNFLVRIPDEVYNSVFAEIADGVNGGESKEQIADRVDLVLDYTASERWPNRARVIAQTETTRAYGAGTLAAGLEQSRVTGRLLRKRWLCLTPDHVVTAAEVRWAARRWYEGEVITTTTSNKARVTMTPEHEVLTKRGWVEAKYLNLSDKIAYISLIDTDRTPQVERGNPCLGECVDSLLDLGGPATTGRPWGMWRRMDLNGDKFTAEYVYVVSTDCDLLFGLETMEQEPFKNFTLKSSDKTLAALVTDSLPVANHLRMLDPLVDFRKEASPLFLDLWRLQGNSEESSFAPGPQGNFGFPEDPCDGGAGRADHETDSPDGMSSFIKFTDVMSIEIGSFSGHVYDLSTECHWFAANGLIVHNSEHDSRVRASHREVDGEVRDLGMPYYVDGAPLQFPGDPIGPPESVINCRCDLVILNEEGR